MAIKNSSQFLQNLKDIINQTVATQKSINTNAKFNLIKQVTTPQPYIKTTSTNPVVNGSADIKNALTYLGNAGQYLDKTLYGIGKQVITQPFNSIVNSVATNPNVVNAGSENSPQLRGAVLRAIPNAIYQDSIKPVVQDAMNKTTKAFLSAFTVPKQLKTAAANLNPNNPIPQYLQARPQTTYNVPKALQGLVGAKTMDTLQKGYQTAGEQTGQIWNQNIPAYEKVVGTAEAFAKPVLETIGGFGMINAGAKSLGTLTASATAPATAKVEANIYFKNPKSAADVIDTGNKAFEAIKQLPENEQLPALQQLYTQANNFVKYGAGNITPSDAMSFTLNKIANKTIGPIGSLFEKVIPPIAPGSPVLTQNAGEMFQGNPETYATTHFQPAVGLSVKEVSNQPDINKVAGKDIVPQPTANEMVPTTIPLAPIVNNAIVPIQSGVVSTQGIIPTKVTTNNQVGSQEIQNGGNTNTASAQPQAPAPSNVNLNSYNISDVAKDVLRSFDGATEKNPITYEEVLNLANAYSGTFRDISRDAVVKLITRQVQMKGVIGTIAEKAAAGTATPEEIQTMIKDYKIVKDHASAFGTLLGSENIKVVPGKENSVNNVLFAVVRMTKDTQSVLDAAAKMTPKDWKNGAKVQQFYRQFIKPSVGEVLTEYRMTNMLSGPRTGIRNFAVNAVQGGLLRPLVKLTSGGVDYIGSALSGKQQTHYIQEVPPYYKGFLNSIPQAVNKFVEVMKSGMYNIQDVREIPTGKIPTWYTTLSRALGAADAFSHEMIYGGEKESLLTRAKLQGKELTPKLLADIDQEAHNVAAKYLFHGKTDAKNITKQGYLLSGIDTLTNWAYAGKKVPGGNILIPFIKTSAEVMKQDIELSPAGFLNIPGSRDKVESFSKSLIGSVVLLGAAYLAAIGLLTGNKPKDKKAAALWDSAHKQAWSLKVGDTYVSYSDLGPIGTPLAIAAIFKDELGDNPSDKMIDNAKQIITSIISFFGSQTWIGNLSKLSDVIAGKDYAITGLAASSASQFIPQESLLRSMAGITDAIKRDPKTFIEKLKASIPFLEKTNPAATDINGQPIIKQFNFINSVSPFTISKEDPLYVKKLNDYTKVQTFNTGQKDILSEVKSNVAKKLQNGTATLGDITNAVKAGAIPDNKASVEEFIAENKFVKERANLSAKIASGNATIGDITAAVKAGWISDSKSAVETFITSAKDPVLGYFANLPTISQINYMKQLKSIGDTDTINKLAPYVNNDWWKYTKQQ